MSSDTSGSSLTRLAIDSADGARGAISTHGAHLLSWQPAGGGEWLYLSGRAQAGPGQAIRGGVPVIFPQFAGEGPLPKHGFARGLPWALIAHGRDDAGRGYARYALTDSDATRAIWPHAFVAELTVTLGGTQLQIALQIHNTGNATFTFTAALHSYFRVGTVADARIIGLQELHYRDSANGNAACVEREASVAVIGEVDRIYFNAPASVELRDGSRALRVVQHGFNDLVVWNPGAGKAAALADLDPGGWQQMLCIEAAVISTPVTLAAGAEWRASQILEAL